MTWMSKKRGKKKGHPHKDDIMLLVIGNHRRELLKNVARAVNCTHSELVNSLIDDYLSDWVAKKARTHGPRFMGD